MADITRTDNERGLVTTSYDDHVGGDSLVSTESDIEELYQLAPTTQQHIVDDVPDDNGGNHSLSPTADRIDKSTVLRRLGSSEAQPAGDEPAKANWPRLKGNAKLWGHRWRTYSPWLSTALIITGTALSLTGVGVAVGGPLLIAGVSIGVADRVVDVGVDVYRYKKGEISGKRLAGNTLANTACIALLAVPVAGHITAAIPGQVGQILQTGTNAIASTNLSAGMASGGAGAVELTSGIYRGWRSFKDRPEREVIKVQGDNIPYRDPLNDGAETTLTAQEFVETMHSVSSALVFVDPPSDFYPAETKEREKEEAAQNNQNVENKNSLMEANPRATTWCRIVVELNIRKHLVSIPF